ncbi:hypothetical protein [Flexistipes sinusarabici]|uniref:hypothetical protein n=1 Tax=Flexistipes sinusarabici TaxID=2352 RepID=UPI0023543AEE|nr:hypothetical protein [Flexistipes sinusarabici]
MAKKKTHKSEEVPVDKVEAFLEKNFKKIMISIGGIILAIIVVYGVFTVIQSNKQQKISRLGQYEQMFQTDNLTSRQIQNFLEIGTEVDEVASYTKYRAANLYLNAGNLEKAKELLNKTGGSYKELADSLLYDLGENINLSQYTQGSYLERLWDYRELLKSGYTQEKLDQFAKNYPDSRLLELLKNWE